MMTATVDRVVQVFEHLTEPGLDNLPQIYAPNAWFKDPFNEVTGIVPIQAIFRHMYRRLDSPHFVVTNRIAQDSQCFLSWEFRFRFRRYERETEQTIYGSSHLVFDESGLIVKHRDYWDAAAELYEKLPVLGPVMRWLKRQANS